MFTSMNASKAQQAQRRVHLKKSRCSSLVRSIDSAKERKRKSFTSVKAGTSAREEEEEEEEENMFERTRASPSSSSSSSSSSSFSAAVAYEEYHTVVPGDSLYGIAIEYGIDPRELIVRSFRFVSFLRVSS